MIIQSILYTSKKNKVLQYTTSCVNPKHNFESMKLDTKDETYDVVYCSTFFFITVEYALNDHMAMY